MCKSKIFVELFYRKGISIEEFKCLSVVWYEIVFVKVFNRGVGEMVLGFLRL